MLPTPTTSFKYKVNGAWSNWGIMILIITDFLFVFWSSESIVFRRIKLFHDKKPLKLLKDLFPKVSHDPLSSVDNIGLVLGFRNSHRCHWCLPRAEIFQNGAKSHQQLERMWRHCASKLQILSCYTNVTASGSKGQHFTGFLTL